LRTVKCYVQPPGIGYYLTAFTVVLASRVIIASTFPLLAQITGPEYARTD
jgi:hypothetical protein